MKHIIMMIVKTYQIFICEGNLNSSYILIHGNHQQPYAVILLLSWSWLDWVISSKDVQLTKLENCRVWFELRLWIVCMICVYLYISVIYVVRYLYVCVLCMFITHGTGFHKLWAYRPSHTSSHLLFLLCPLLLVFFASLHSLAFIFISYTHDLIYLYKIQNP